MQKQGDYLEVLVKQGIQIMTEIKRDTKNLKTKPK